MIYAVMYIHAMNWWLIGQVLYVLVILLVAMRIVYDTRGAPKTMAYLLLIYFVPILGVGIYLAIGLNYRKRRRFSDKEFDRSVIQELLSTNTEIHSEHMIEKHEDKLQDSGEKLARLLLNENLSPLTSGNKVDLLINGEQKFPRLLADIQAAKHHIHVQYYIFADDTVSREVAEALMKKAREGVIVRFLFDDFGSHAVHKDLLEKMRDAGMLCHAYFPIRFYILAARMNYRNHRKIVVIDGEIGYTGGINVSEDYMSNSGRHWRDTHIRIQGQGVMDLQYTFMSDWNFCDEVNIEASNQYFPLTGLRPPRFGSCLVQVVASGPDSKRPSILYSIYQAIYVAEQEILITTPYFIPGRGVQEALMIAALSEVKVKLLLPENSDSMIVDSAARSYFEELIDAGVEIHLYEKGMIHAKTMVVDERISIVGSANMDSRSFELNFELNAIIYDRAFAGELKAAFVHDLGSAEMIDLDEWNARPLWRSMWEKVTHLVSPLM